MNLHFQELLKALHPLGDLLLVGHAEEGIPRGKLGQLSAQHNTSISRDPAFLENKL